MRRARGRRRCVPRRRTHKQQHPKPYLKVDYFILPIWTEQIRRMFRFLGPNVADYLAEQWSNWTIVDDSLYHFLLANNGMATLTYG